MNKKPDYHNSYHSGTNEIYHDYSGNSGTIHDHGSAGTRWEKDDGKTYQKVGDGWVETDGTKNKSGG